MDKKKTLQQYADSVGKIVALSEVGLLSFDDIPNYSNIFYETWVGKGADVIAQSSDVDYCGSIYNSLTFPSNWKKPLEWWAKKYNKIIAIDHRGGVMFNDKPIYKDIKIKKMWMYREDFTGSRAIYLIPRNRIDYNGKDIDSLVFPN